MLIYEYWTFYVNCYNQNLKSVADLQSAALPEKILTNKKKTPTKKTPVKARATAAVASSKKATPKKRAVPSSRGCTYLFVFANTMMAANY
jgi:hypothetical protein